MAYRREIDGLRALAVLPVLLFHAGIPGFTGGFAGVDVFFVISGYLITGLIVAELGSGGFSLAAFYERRARRLLPALTVVVLITLPVAWLWLGHQDFLNFARSVQGVALFGSNIVFAKQRGYFAPAADQIPLLHSWSLAVEEQFYLLYPLLLLLLWRVGQRGNRDARPVRTTIAALAGLAVASFVAAVWWVAHDPKAAFFLLPTRSWELLAGGMLALSGADRTDGSEGTADASSASSARRLRRVVIEAGAIVGLALIAWSVVTSDPRDVNGMAFPGWSALVPASGAVLVLACARAGTWVGRLLSLRPLVGIGLISYSAYLWHHPLLAFARHRSLLEPPRWQLVLLLLAALGLAALTWRVVEQPFRQTVRWPRRRVALAAVGASLLLFAAGSAAMAAEGARWRPMGVRSGPIDKRLEFNDGLGSRCAKLLTPRPGQGAQLHGDCVSGPQPVAVLWGDSYAMQLADGLRASSPDLPFAQLTAFSCQPILGVSGTTPESSADWPAACMRHNEAVVDWIARHPSVTHVLIASHFEAFFPWSKLVWADGRRPTVSRGAGERAFRATLARLDTLGVTPVIVSAMPMIDVDIGGCLARAVRFGELLARCDLPRAEVNRRRLLVTAALERLERDYAVIWLRDALCDATRCRAAFGDSLLFYRDDSHLTREGSRWLGRTMHWGERIRAARPPGSVRVNARAGVP